MAFTPKKTAPAATGAAQKQFGAPSPAPDFNPVGGDGVFLSLDCKSGKVKIRGLNEAPDLLPSLPLHMDFRTVQTGWITFPGGAKIIGTDRNALPAVPAGQDLPKWGALVQTASPYPVPGLNCEGIGAHDMTITAAVALIAIGEAYALWQRTITEQPEYADKVPVFTVATWSKAGQNFAPRLELSNFADGLEVPAAD